MNPLLAIVISFTISVSFVALVLIAVIVGNIEAQLKRIADKLEGER